MAPEIDVGIIGDLAFNTDKTPYGEKTSMGGAAYYAAVGAALFSARVGVVARIGDDFDLSYLQHRRIDTQGVTVVPEGQTCRFILIQHTDNTRGFYADRGVAARVEENTFPDIYLRAQYIHLATSLPQNYLYWLELLKGKTDAIRSVDTFEAFTKQYPDETRQAVEAADIVFINATEASILNELGGVARVAPWILKHGAGGVEYIEDGEVRYTISAPRIKHVVDTTGAGDVLAGAFLAQRARGVPIEAALISAVSVASFSITQFGVEHIQGHPRS